MSLTFADLKKNRNKDLESVAKDLEGMTKTSGTFERDPRFWKLKNTEGNGAAVIRFMPTPFVDIERFGEEAKSLVRFWEYVFKGPPVGNPPVAKRYWERSLRSLGKKDPVAEVNSALWATGTKANQDICRSRRTKLQFIANIQVIKDPACPENEGKFFLFQFGKQIYDMIMDQLNPAHDDEEDDPLAEVSGKKEEEREPIDVFNFWEGADFKIRLYKDKSDKKAIPTYEKSTFLDPAPMKNPETGKAYSDKELEEIWKNLYSLMDEVAEDKFKTYEELQAIFDDVMGVGARPTPPAPTGKAEPQEEPAAEEEEAPRSKPARKSAPAAANDEDDYMAELEREINNG